MENELVTTKIEKRVFTVFFKKIGMHEDLIKLSKVLEKQGDEYADKPIRNFGDYGLRIYFVKNRDLILIELIKPMMRNIKQILVSNSYTQKEIVRTAIEILPPRVKTQYLLWKEDII